MVCTGHPFFVRRDLLFGADYGIIGIIMKGGIALSRSYRKHPIINDNGHGARWAKTHANRLFRRSRRDLRAGKSAYHHKYTDSWSIHDYRNRWTREKAEAEWEEEKRRISRGHVHRDFDIFWHNLYGSKKRFMGYWTKKMRRK